MAMKFSGNLGGSPEDLSSVDKRAETEVHGAGVEHREHDAANGEWVDSQSLPEVICLDDRSKQESS